MHWVRVVLSTLHVIILEGVCGDADGKFFISYHCVRNTEQVSRNTGEEGNLVACMKFPIKFFSFFHTFSLVLVLE